MTTSMPANSVQPYGYRRTTFWIGTAAFAALTAMAAVFYLERMAFLDMAFQTFQILRTGALQIQSGRFGAAGTQIFAWSAQAAGMPLKGVLLTYSIGHVLYYYGIFALLLLVLRQWQWGLVLILSVTLITTHTFYWLSEMPQGLAFLLLLLGWMQTKDRLGSLRWFEFIVLAAGVATAFYFHPMVLYAMLFCGVYLHQGNASTTGKKGLWWLGIVLFGAVAVLKYKVLKLDWYDAMSLERASAFRSLWPHWFDIQSNRDFLQWCLRDYYLAPALIVLNTGVQLWRKRWFAAAWCLCFPVAFVLLVNVPFYRGDNQFYLENLYLPLAVFAAVPFVFGVLPLIKSHRLRFGLIALLLVVSLWRIYEAHGRWTDRLHWEQSFLHETAALPQRKLLLSEQQAPMDKLVLSWGTSYEFLLLSALEHPDSARCLLVDEAPERFDSLLARPRLFLGEFKNYRYDALPRRYFNLQDTSAYVRWK